MFVAGIEIFFGFIVGAFLLWLGVILGALVWLVLKQIPRGFYRLATCHWGFRIALILIPLELLLGLGHESLAALWVVAALVLINVNRIFWTWRMRKQAVAQ